MNTSEPNNYNKTLICIVGPTGIGKSNLAIRLAKTYNSEIISADSRQFYREMSIGTAKPTKDELSTVPHHFIDSLSIFDEYSAGDYEKDALHCIHNLFSKHTILFLVGGSGLFINAVCTGLDNLPKPGDGIRQKIKTQLDQEGLISLQNTLKRVDEPYYYQVDINNPQRVVRALEVYETTGVPFSEWRKKEMGLRKFNIVTIGLEADREQLYKRINQRVDNMIDNGLLDEVKTLHPHKHLNPLISVGYTELFEYLENKRDFESAVAQMKQNTRRYAKRQITWFKRNENTRWFSPLDYQKIKNYVDTHVIAPGTGY